MIRCRPMCARKFIVTSGLPYSNGRLHVGHIAGAYLPADTWVRYLRARGDEVRFICGSDDNGVASLISAVKEGRSVSFGCPAVPVARLDFTVPGEGVKVTVEPNLATTRTDEGSGVTRVMAYVGAAPELRRCCKNGLPELSGLFTILSETEAGVPCRMRPGGDRSTARPSSGISALSTWPLGSLTSST